MIFWCEHPPSVLAISTGPPGAPAMNTHYVDDDIYHHDSFMGPSLSLRPEELERLDASQYEPHSSLSIDASHYRNLEQSIERTVNQYNNNNNNNNGQFQSASPHVNGLAGYQRDSVFGYQINSTPAGGALTNDKNMILTPPSSSQHPINNIQKGERDSMMLERLKMERDTTLSQMQKNFDQRLEALKRHEGESIRQLETGHSQQLQKLNGEFDLMIKQHQQVLSLKNEVERGLQSELEITKRELTREKEFRQTDREKYQRNIKDLNNRIRELERRMEELKRGGQPTRKGKSRSISFYDDDDDYERVPREYEERLEKLRRENDVKIANLVRHFEKEKAAALEILKSKVKAEISLLIPRMKEQCQKAYTEKARTLRDSLSIQFRDQYEAKLRRLKEEHVVERRVWQRQAREQVEQERAGIVQTMKAKYELKIMEVRNECERRLLQRLRGSNGGRRDDSFDNSSGNDSLDSSINLSFV